MVLLTGASSGLGLVIARQLLARGRHRLILTARESSLSRFAAHGVHASEHVRLRPLDVTHADERRAVVEEADATWGGVDVLINNAGVSFRAVVEHVTDGERLAQMEVNFLGPMELARLVLPTMRAKRSGRILNISSVGGMMAMPTMAVYSASKFALEGATEALWYEVRPWNIHVSLIQPGFIHSESFRNVRFTELSQRAAEDPTLAYAAHYRHMGSFIERMMRRVPATPERVARKVLRTMERRHPPLRVAATFDARLFGLLRRVLPRRFYHWLLYRNLPHIAEWGGPPARGPVRTSSPSEPPPQARSEAPDAPSSRTE
ncbi:MAG: SDR family NAD(P)-dependent oxidoreductase [Deltaproteobacteria bacterium]|nr:MAG: SDR family NAD(P)-dependent oxidoreductase [Deltaproteobacteria bacterium]